MAQPEPIAMPRMPKYQPQVDIDPDDPDNYMILVPANINKKWPMSQLGIYFVVVDLFNMYLSIC